MARGAEEEEGEEEEEEEGERLHGSLLTLFLRGTDAAGDAAGRWMRTNGS